MDYYCIFKIKMNTVQYTQSNLQQEEKKQERTNKEGNLQ